MYPTDCEVEEAARLESGRRIVCHVTYVSNWLW